MELKKLKVSKSLLFPYLMEKEKMEITCLVKASSHDKLYY